jgi:iron complex transport system substrate-binding protein
MRLFFGRSILSRNVFHRWMMSAALFGALCIALPAWADAPQRIVSLNLCTDELLLRLADRQQILSVTWLSRDAGASNVADLAARVPVNHGLAEEVVPLQPDLVLGGTYTTTTAVALIRRHNFPIVLLGIAAGIDDSRLHIQEVAAAIGQPERGATLIADIDRRLAAIAPLGDKPRLRALVLNPAGFTVGSGSLIDDILRRAGLENLAARPGAPIHMPLEFVAASAPDLLILNAERDGPPSLATDMLKHPVLAGMRGTRTIVLPARLWTCGGPGSVEAIERLAAVAREVRP